MFAFNPVSFSFLVTEVFASVVAISACSEQGSKASTCIAILFITLYTRPSTRNWSILEGRAYCQTQRLWPTISIPNGARKDTHRPLAAASAE